MIDAIFVPRGVEERAVRRGLGRRGAAIAVYPTGFGASSARAAEAVLANGVRPEGAVIAGLCGSLDPAFASGDVLLYASIAASDGPTIETDRSLTMDLQRAVPGAQSGVRGLAVGRVVTRASEKRELAASSGAQAIDMEAYALAARLREAGVALAVLRCVSDGADADLPDLIGVFGAEGVNARGFARSILSKPLAGMRLVVGGTRGVRSLRRAFRGLRP